ncbi:MAG: trypsin-like peptidase domain-containing protein, partial [Eubacteriales bacterium]|nr:trypsin-like peptidase domain-containing protein [Eubacteriales bacterium]
SRFLNTGSTAQGEAAQSESSSAQATLQIAGQNESQAGTESSEADASDSISSTEVTQGNTQAGVADISTVAANVMPSIVSVYNSYTQNTAYFGQTYSREVTSTGSGIIVGQTDSELLIVTNNHVVDGEESLKVQFVDNTTAEAQLKGTDPGSDLAVIAVDLSSISSETSGQIKVATLGSSDDLLVGESVIAIGNALGYGQSVTVGVVSALDREITTSDGATGTFIQTDAAINPGNSGGALVNTRGEVIGINSNKIGGTSVEGMGYAIPISRAEPIIQNLMNQETRSRVDSSNQGYLGISGVSVTEQISSAYNMPTGVYVAQVMEDGAAANSDLQTGDIITAFNGSGITSMDDLKEQLAYYEAGTEVTLTVKRANSENGYDEIQVTVTLGTQPETQTQDQQQQQQSGQSGNGQGNLFGYFFGN